MDMLHAPFLCSLLIVYAYFTIRISISNIYMTITTMTVCFMYTQR